MGNLNTFPIFRPLDGDSGSTSKFMGGLSVQPTTHAAKKTICNNSMCFLEYSNIIYDSKLIHADLS